jgi:Integrase core domain
VVVHNFDLVGVSLAPHKANTPLVVDANAALPFPVTFQFLQSVSWKRRKCSQVRRSVEQVQLPKCLSLNSLEPAHRLTAEEALGIGTAEGPDHLLMLYCFPLNVKRYGAIAWRRPRPGLVHHSDRGLQYARGEYVTILEKHGIVPSMSRPANPYDNASCESFMKTLKREEIYANRYDNLEHLRANIEEFIEQYYNRQRLHSALGYKSPEEFERETAQGNWADSSGATVEFVVHDGNNESQERDATELSGDEDSNAVLFPRPLLLLQDATKAE